MAEIKDICVRGSFYIRMAAGMLCLSSGGQGLDS